MAIMPFKIVVCFDRVQITVGFEMCLSNEPTETFLLLFVTQIVHGCGASNTK